MISTTEVTTAGQYWLAGTNQPGRTSSEADSIGDLVDTAEMLGFVSRTGAWYLLPDGSKVQGRDAFVSKVKEDKELHDSLYEKVHSV